MTDTATVDRTAELEAKIDALTVQVQFLADEAVEQRRRRIAMEELQADLTPIATAAVGNAAIALDQADIDAGDLVNLAVRVAENADLLEKAIAQLESAGYFEFAEAGIGVIDRIVTGYSKEDVEALADNVVQMLDIVKDLTQPDMLAVTQRMLDVVHKQAEINSETITEPPSLFALAGKVRDPEVRMGIGRALDTLKAVANAGEIDSNDPEENQPTPMEVNDATSSDS